MSPAQRTLLAVGASALGAACGPEPYAWERPSASAAAPVVAPPPRAAASGSAGEEPTAAPPAKGVHEACWRGLEPSGEPVRDVTRLSLACGASLGMTRVTSTTLEGAIAEGGAFVSFPLELVRGRCYRVFAAATPDVGELETLVRSSRGTTIGTDHAKGTISIIQPDRPLCALEDDTAELRVSAGTGRGRFALEIYDDRPSDAGRGR